ncbi:MAG: hypothetical protein H0T85_09715 [Geodermatophilaceae bacterium]|nr:hypothetical protein [Geodermatophilaceae bacterium]
MAEMIREKAPKARPNHGRRQLGGRLVNDLVGEPAALRDALVDSGHVVARPVRWVPTAAVPTS